MVFDSSSDACEKTHSRIIRCLPILFHFKVISWPKDLFLIAMKIIIDEFRAFPISKDTTNGQFKKTFVTR